MLIMSNVPHGLHTNLNPPFEKGGFFVKSAVRGEQFVANETACLKKYSDQKSAAKCPPEKPNVKFQKKFEILL